MVVASPPRVYGLSSHTFLTLITVSGMKFTLWSKPHIQSENGYFQDINVTIAPVPQSVRSVIAHGIHIWIRVMFTFLL